MRSASVGVRSWRSSESVRVQQKAATAIAEGVSYEDGEIGERCTH